MLGMPRSIRVHSLQRVGKGVSEKKLIARSRSLSNAITARSPSMTRLRGEVSRRERKICRAARQNASLVGWRPYLSSGRRYDRRADPRTNCPAAHGNLTRASSLICLSALWSHLSVHRTTSPPPRELPIRVGGHTAAASALTRAGGSDRKVSAVIDGKTVYSKRLSCTENRLRPAVSV